MKLSLLKIGNKYLMRSLSFAKIDYDWAKHLWNAINYSSLLIMQRNYEQQHNKNIIGINKTYVKNLWQNSISYPMFDGKKLDWWFICSTFKIVHEVIANWREPRWFLSFKIQLILVRKDLIWKLYFILFLH